MYQVFESLKIALAAIWASKLRSFLTVLGNIVAVTSIIAVVSLVQGIDDYVSNAIESDLGVGTFSIQRFGMIRSEEEFEKVAGNPLITEKDATAVRKADLVKAVMTQASSNAEVRYKDRSIESIPSIPSAATTRSSAGTRSNGAGWSHRWRLTGSGRWRSSAGTSPTSSFPTRIPSTR